MKSTSGPSGIKWVFLFWERVPDQTQTLYKSDFSLTHGYIQIGVLQVTATEMSKCTDSNSGEELGQNL